MAPLLSGVVEDAFENGRGRLDVKLRGVVPIVRGRGAEIDRGEALRYLAELVWCPLALLQNTAVSYSEIATGRSHGHGRASCPQLRSMYSFAAHVVTRECVQ